METLWTDNELADFLRISKQKIRTDRMHGTLPFPVVRIGRCCRYRPSDVIEFIEKQAKGSVK